MPGNPKWDRQRKWQQTNAQKRAAHRAVELALRRGDLKRGKCAVCGSLRVDAHHHKGYAPENWLQIVFLCRRHHMAAHKATAEKVA